MNDSWLYPIRYNILYDKLRNEISNSNIMSWEMYLSYIELNRIDRWLQLIQYKGKISKYNYKRIQFMLDKLELKHEYKQRDTDLEISHYHYNYKMSERNKENIDSPLQFITNYQELTKFCLECIQLTQEKIKMLPNVIKWQCQSVLSNFYNILTEEENLAWYPLRLALRQCQLFLFPFQNDNDVKKLGMFHPMLISHLKWLKLNLYTMQNAYWDNLVTQITLFDPFTMSNFHNGLIRINEDKDLILQLPNITDEQIKNFLHGWTFYQSKIWVKHFVKQGKWVYKGPLYICRFIYCFFEVMSYNKSVAKQNCN